MTMTATADPMLAVAVGKADPLGMNRLREEDAEKPWQARAH